MNPNYLVKAFTEKTWSDFVLLFGKHKGVRGGCWCVHNRCTSTQYDKMNRDDRKAFQEALVHKGQGHGLLVYNDSQPIAWCQFGPIDGFPRYDRGRKYRKLDIPTELRPKWRISCLFVDKHRRREGWSKVALREALLHIKRNGGGVVEAFPFDVPEAKHPSYAGSVKMYLQEGFEVVTEVGKYRFLVRCRLPSSS